MVINHKIIYIFFGSVKISEQYRIWFFLRISGKRLSSLSISVHIFLYIIDMVFLLFNSQTDTWCGVGLEIKDWVRIFNVKECISCFCFWILIVILIWENIIEDWEWIMLYDFLFLFSDCKIVGLASREMNRGWIRKGKLWISLDFAKYLGFLSGQFLNRV